MASIQDVEQVADDLESLVAELRSELKKPTSLWAGMWISGWWRRYSNSDVVPAFWAPMITNPSSGTPAITLRGSPRSPGSAPETQPSC